MILFYPQQFEVVSLSFSGPQAQLFMSLFPDLVFLAFALAFHKQPHPFFSFIMIAFTGQFLLQALHSVHSSGFLISYFPDSVCCGSPKGHTSAHKPHLLHKVSFINILKSFIDNLFKLALNSDSVILHTS